MATQADCVRDALTLAGTPPTSCEMRDGLVIVRVGRLVWELDDMESMHACLTGEINRGPDYVEANNGN